MSMENTTNRMIRNAQSVIYYNRIKLVEETIKEIESVTSKDILELSNQFLDYNNYKKVVISSKNLLLKNSA
jgi:predicted Zn-dependent peptidase